MLEEQAGGAEKLSRHSGDSLTIPRTGRGAIIY